ncbi:MAG: hypothetical protein AAF702_41865 [Chloroflexota bacterium]
MILLGRNQEVIEGITIFPDHDTTQNQFWYLSGPVRLAEKDGDSVFTLLKYQQADNEGAGFAMFEVNIGLPEDVERKIRSKLPEGATLSAVPFNQGIVKTMVLDESIGDSPPTLYGDNTAIFSLPLDEVQTPLLEQAFEGEAQPIGVVYDLEFTAMRPTLDVKLEADLSRVYSELQASIGFEGVIPTDPPFMLDTSIEAGFQKLVQEGAINMEVFTFVDDEDVKAQREEALRLFMDVLLKEWFEPTLALPKITDTNDKDDLPIVGSTNEGEEGEGNDTGIGDDIEDIVDAAQEIMPTVKVKLRAVHQEELKKVSYRFSGAQTTTRKYYPQGFFSRLLKDVKSGKGIVAVDIDDPFFRTISIDVQAPQINYEKYGLQSVHFAAQYPDRSIASRIFDKDTPSHAEPIKFAVNRALDTDYSYQVQYNFLPDAGWDGEHLTKELPWQVTEDRSQVLIPHQHIGFLDINVSLERNYYWGNIQEVQVHLNYKSPDSDWSKQEVLYFNPDSETEQHWRVRLNAPTANPEYSYSLLYRMNDDTTEETAVVTSVIPGVAVPDLTKKKLDVEVEPLLDPAIDKWAYLDIKYEDPDNDYTWEKSVRVAAGTTASIDLQIPLMDVSKPEFQYTLTFIRTNNERFTKSFPKAKYTRILAESIGMGELAVEVTPEEIDWDAIRIVTVDLLYQDAQNDIHDSANHTFKKYDQPFTWKVKTADKSLGAYQWRATFYMRDPSLGDGGEVYYPATEGAWESASTKFLFLDKFQPKEEKLAVEVSAEDLDWDELEKVRVTLEYKDRANDISEKEKVTLTADDDLYEWSVKLADPKQATYSWRAKFYPNSGRTQSARDKEETDTFLDLDQVYSDL